MTYDDIKKIYPDDDLIIKKDLSNPNRMKQRPKKSTLELVLSVIRSYNGIRRALLVKKSEVSGHAIDRSIEALLDDELIKRDKIGNFGPHPIYVYRVI